MTQQTVRMTAAGMALGLMAPMAGAKSSVDKKTAWGAATAGLGVGAIIAVAKEKPVEAAVLGAGAVYSYSQYNKAKKDDTRSSYRGPYTNSTYNGTYNGGVQYQPVRVDDYSDNSSDPPGWRNGNKNGWNGRNMPPGQAKKQGRNNPYDPYYNDPNYNDQYDNGNNGWRPGRATRPGAGQNGRYDNSYGYGSGMTGRITSTGNAWDRTIKVDLGNGDVRSVDVAKDAQVSRYGRPVSMHDLKTNEIVRITPQNNDYNNNGGTIRASRVEVVDGYSNNGNYNPGYNGGYSGGTNGGFRPGSTGRYPGDTSNRGGVNTTISGQVNSIDSGAGILRVDANGRRLTVYTNNANIRRGSRGVSLRDLDYGNRVTIQGQRVGDTVYATRVDVR